MMNTRFFRLFVQLIILAGIIGSSCATGPQRPTAFSTPVARASATNNATLIPSPTPIPTLQGLAAATPVGTPFPTASTIRGDVIAFILPGAKGLDSFSLWIANVDGSGEKRIVENIDNSQGPEYRISFILGLSWSPDGKWISYDANDALWLVSPDGSIVKEVLRLPDKSKGILYAWSWSPDGSRIAFAQAPAQDANPRHASVGIVDVPSGQVHHLLDFDFGYQVTLTWTQDGRFLWLNGPRSLGEVDAASGRVVQCASGVQQDSCWTAFFDRIVWSTDTQWFAVTEHGNGIGAGSWFCAAGVDGTQLQSPRFGSTTTPIWDHTRDVIYFVARDVTMQPNPNFDQRQRLMRLDARSQKLEQLLPLANTTRDFMWSLSLSPAGRILALHSQVAQHAQEFVVLNMDTFSAVHYQVKLGKGYSFYLYHPAVPDWTSDGQSLVFVLEAPHPIGEPPPAWDLSFWDYYYYPYLVFYKLDIHTGKVTAISGWHEKVGEWAISPAPVSR